MLLKFLLLSITVINVDALKCYVCSYAGGLDQKCVTEPESTEEDYVVDCNKNYCLSVRIEDKNSRNAVLSMIRYCDDTYVFKNKVVEDDLLRSYYKVCQTDLCNGGTGKELSASGKNRDDGDPIVLLVPGTGSGNTLSSWFYLLFIAILSYIL